MYLFNIEIVFLSKPLQIPKPVQHLTIIFILVTNLADARVVFYLFVFLAANKLLL